MSSKQEREVLTPFLKHARTGGCILVASQAWAYSRSADWLAHWEETGLL
jgi:hypothetical protein